MITLLMSLTLKTGVNALLPFLCICKYFTNTRMLQGWWCFILFSLNEANKCDLFLFSLWRCRSDVEEGGETVFPDAKGNFSSVPGWNEMSECAKRGLSIKPKMGNALLFWSLHPDATLDPSSLHGEFRFSFSAHNFHHIDLPIFYSHLSPYAKRREKGKKIKDLQLIICLSISICFPVSVGNWLRNLIFLCLSKRKRCLCLSPCLFSRKRCWTTFYNLFPGSCPVIKGKKWSATKWMHLREFGVY